jgi:hypothetical protein
MLDGKVYQMQMNPSWKCGKQGELQHVMHAVQCFVGLTWTAMREWQRLLQATESEDKWM